MYTKEAMRARLADLKAEREAITSVSEPLREARDEYVRAARAKEDELNAQVKAAEVGLFELDMEIGLLAKALGGRSLSAETA